MKPSIGRVVHYVSFGTPGGEYTRECRAAIVTEVTENADTVGLCVLNPTGMFFNRTVTRHDGAETPGDSECDGAMHDTFRYCACGWREAGHAGGTWHWPERVD